MLEQLFTSLGLNENETRVFLALAKLGKAPASLLAKKVEVPRSTAYAVLENLLKKGVVSVERTQEVSFYIANQPDSLLRMVEEEEKDSEALISRKLKAAQELVPLLGPHFKKENYSVPRLQFFEGTANVSTMLYSFCRKWQESIAACDFTWWGYQDHQFVKTYRDWLDYYWASMKPGEKICLLSNESGTEKQLRGNVKRRIIKVLPRSRQFSSTVWVLGEYVVTIMTRQKPHYAFQLQDAVFAANQRLTFQLLWDIV